MNPLDDFIRRFEYHFWATEKLAASLDDNEHHAKSRGYLAHSLVADALWLLRIKGHPWADLVLFPTIPVADIQKNRVNNKSNYGAFLPTADFSAEVAYTTTSGTRYENTIGDILNHVLLHGMYHRGQVAAALREAGTAPPATDFIAWVRLQ